MCARRGNSPKEKSGRSCWWGRTSGRRGVWGEPGSSPLAMWPLKWRFPWVCTKGNFYSKMSSSGFGTFYHSTWCPVKYFFSPVHGQPQEAWPGLICPLLPPLCLEHWLCPQLGSSASWSALSGDPFALHQSITICRPVPPPPRPATRLHYPIVFSPKLVERRRKRCFNWKLPALCMIKPAHKPLSTAEDDTKSFKGGLFL